VRTSRDQTTRPANSPRRFFGATTDREARHHHRRRDVQGLRAVAVLLVVLYHAGLPVPGGFTGVDVFFVISGFVITGTLLAELVERGTISLLRFYARRIRRLLPALAAMLVAIAVLGILAAPLAAQSAAASAGVWASIFAGNLYFYRAAVGYFDVTTTLNPLLHTWTLGVEEQFYLFFPALLLGVWWLARRASVRRPRALLVAAVALVSLVSFAISLAGSFGRPIPGVTAPLQFAFYVSPARAWEFGLGALVALLVPLAMRLPGAAAAVLGAGGAAALVVAGTALEDTDRFPGWAALVPTLGTTALLVAGTAAAGPLTRALSTEPFVWIGDRSYSWYLWHWPLIVFAKALWPGVGVAAPAAAAVSLLPSWASYRYVENPIRFGPRFRGFRVVPLAAGCVVLPIAAAAALSVANDRLSTLDAVEEWSLTQRDHLDLTEGCASPAPLGERPPDTCTWRVDGARGTILLIGDSNAGQFTEPLLHAAAASRFDVVVATNNGCPFLDVRVDGTAAGVDGCRRFYLGSLAAIESERPSLVVTAARTDRYLENEPVGIGAATAGAISHDGETKARRWKEGLRSSLQRLTAAGVPVIVIHPAPLLPTEPTDCAAARILLRRCRDSIRRDELAGIQRRALRAERGALAGLARAKGIDFHDTLCDAELCPSRRGGTDLYRNSNHLSVAGSLTLAEQLEQVIEEHARAAPRRE
jgi:peptidoglycan/LPS O-acetylase OafA/YrhL